jgi:4,5-dihydroxyphthalate decarboxylase
LISRARKSRSQTGHTRALKAGEVPIKGVHAEFVQVVSIIAAFRRMVRDLGFDVCERGRRRT